MPHYRSLAAHNAACNEDFYRFQDCEAEHPIGRFFGCCGDLHFRMTLCLREQRVIQRERNKKLSEERMEKLRTKFREEREKERQEQERQQQQQQKQEQKQDQ